MGLLALLACVLFWALIGAPPMYYHTMSGLVAWPPAGWHENQPLTSYVPTKASLRQKPNMRIRKSVSGVIVQAQIYVSHLKIYQTL